MQPLLVSELVFVLVLRRLWLRQPVRLAAWGAASLTCVGLAVFLVAAEPRGGHLSPTPSAWVTTIAILGGASVLTTALAGRGSPVRRAALYGTASAILGALTAAFIKTATATYTVHGALAVLTSWPIYAVLASGIICGVEIQAALHTGPLTVSQPIMVVLNPIVSIWISVQLFAEYFTGDVAAQAAAAASFAALVVGVVSLTRTAPQEDRAVAGPDSG